MALKKQYEVIEERGNIQEVYEIIPLAECSNSVMFLNGERIVLAYTGRWQKPEGDGWEGRVDIDWQRNGIGMVWSRRTSTNKDGSAA